MDDSPLSLIEPAVTYRQAFQEYAAEFQAAGELYHYHEMAIRDFPAFLIDVEAFKGGLKLSPGLVPMSFYWLIAHERVVGESRLRHRLNDVLEREGGHIGYTIRPSERRKGYGTQILALTMEKARDRGLGRVLVTCDTDNLGSARIIEKNGGVLDGYAISERSRKQVSRYWIDL